MRIASLLLLLLLPVAARADLYSWTDENGVTHYSSRLPKHPAAQKTVKTIKALGPYAHGAAFSTLPKQPPMPAPAAEPAPVAPAPVPPAPVPNKPVVRVELFTTSWCPACKLARDFLDAQGVAYQDNDVESDPVANARFRAQGGQGVPLALIDGKPVRGFSAQAYAALLGASR